MLGHGHPHASHSNRDDESEPVESTGQKSDEPLLAGHAASSAVDRPSVTFHEAAINHDEDTFHDADLKRRLSQHDDDLGDDS